LIWNRPHLQRVLIPVSRALQHRRPQRGVGLEIPVPAPVATVDALPVAERVERVDVLGDMIHEYPPRGVSARAGRHEAARD
jgi:hypothetical protein